MQLAFARVKKSWDEAYLADLSRVQMDRAVDRIVRKYAGPSLNEQVSPADVARALVTGGIDYFQAYVCENLGSPDDASPNSSSPELTHQKFGPLNVMVRVRNPDPPINRRMAIAVAVG